MLFSSELENLIWRTQMARKYFGEKATRLVETTLAMSRWTNQQPCIVCEVWLLTYVHFRHIPEHKFRFRFPHFGLSDVSAMFKKWPYHLPHLDLLKTTLVAHLNNDSNPYQHIFKKRSLPPTPPPKSFKLEYPRVKTSVLLNIMLETVFRRMILGIVGD